MIKKIIRKLKIFIYDINKYIIRGDEGERRYFKAKYKAQFNKIKQKVNGKKEIQKRQEVKTKLFNYLESVSDQKGKDFIFLFSGTTFIQEKRGNRPIRLTNSWLKEGIPVLFSYYRWNTGEEIPTYAQEGLFQVPIDMTMEWIDEIIKYDIQKKNKIFVVSFPYPQLARYIGQLKMHGWKVIYDVRDNWEEFHKVNMAKWYSTSIEKYFVCNCDVVCCVAKPLQEKMQCYTQKNKVLLSPNALDVKFYRDNSNIIKNLDENKITIGYVGHLSDGWFDWESLKKVAETHEEWTIELIGHFEPKGMILPNNILLLGSKEHREIKEITRRWNVAIIPFKMGELSDCVDPIKIYEYLAMELPVVSFRMPQIHDYPNVYIARNVEEFSEKIKEAISIPFNSEANKTFLEKNTWEIRAKEIIEWSREVETIGELL